MIRRIRSRRWVRLVAGGVIAAAYLAWLVGTLPGVPFHPDEATYIFTSRDVARLLQEGPGSIAWQPGNEADPLQHERELSAPLARHVIGVALLVSGLEPTSVDWNWSLSWEANVEDGALPSAAVLLAARIPQAGFLFLSTILMVWVGWRLAGWPGGTAAAILFGLNSQVLLHDRRAMSESALLFGMILVAALILLPRDSGRTRLGRIGWPLLTGAALAIAASAKLTGLLIAPVAVAGMLWLPKQLSLRSWMLAAGTRIAFLLAGFGIVFFALNPLYWAHPVGTAEAVVSARQSLLADQTAAVQAAAPGSLLETFPKRLLAMVYEPCLAQVAFWDIPNYAVETASIEQAYRSSPFLMATSGGWLPAIWLAAVLVGLGMGIRGIRNPEIRRNYALLGVWLVMVAAGILAGVPILWQRYYLPLIPILVLWGSVGVAGVIRVVGLVRSSILTRRSPTAG